MTQDTEQHLDYAELARLGEGGADDRLSLRVISRVLFRCVPLLKEQRTWLHLLGLLAATSMLTLVLAPPILFLIQAFWTVLDGGLLTATQAGLLRLDPAVVTAADAFGAEARKQALTHIVFATMALVPIGLPCALAIFYYRVWVLQRINQVLRLRLLDKLQALSLRFHSNNRVGDAIYRMYQDSSMVTQLIDVMVITPAEILGRLAFSLFLVALWEPRLALTLAVAWPLMLVLSWTFARPMRVGFRSARERNSALTSRIQETLAGIRVIKAYGAERAEQRRFVRDSKDAFAAAYTARNRYATFKVYVFWMIGSALIVSSAWGAWLAANGNPIALAADGSPTALGKIAAALGFAAWNLGLWNNFKDRFGDVALSSRNATDLWGRVQDIAIGLDRVFEVLDREPEVQDAPDAIEMPAFSRGVAFRGLSFRYAPERPVLEDVEFEVPSGSIAAIVGPTGAGKSTLMALLLRLFDPDQGWIEIDGVDTRRFTLESLRKNIAIALQENVLFGATVRENIRYAVPGASDEQVRAAAQVACANEFIARLPNGYDTMLGERGSKLSTGQRQRLSIARAVIKDTPILILDEPTASLDAETELRVLQNLSEWGRDRAIFLITHRLSTIRRTDRIAYIQEGRLGEWGTQTELLSREGGAYRRMVETEDAAVRLLAAGSVS